ncbi:MAG: virulence factor [Parcubacteria group bacterium Gr01-1014_38]|nr:MAG: virulence factor [Parcubacteria group bacterium Gr01-1014_38]
METAPALSHAARSGTAIGAAQLLSYGASFLLNIAIAATFGAARTTDAYFMATSTAELLAKILLGGALTSVLLPLFVEHLAKNDARRAWALFSSLLSLAVIAFFVLGSILQVFAEPLVTFLAPGFSGETRSLTTLLLRLVFPAYLLSFLADLAMVPLHAQRRFGLPALSRLVVPTITLLALLTLAGHVGIRVLVWGTFSGTVVQLSILLIALRRFGYVPTFLPHVKNPDVRRALLLTLPFVLSILAAHGAGIVYRILVSLEPEGSLASLKFGERIFQMANVLFIGTIVQVAFPAFARAVSTSPEEAQQRLQTAIRLVTFVGIPLTIGLILLRTPLVRVLYERGAFTAEDTAATAALVPFFVLGLLGNGWSSLLGHFVLAFQETRMAVAVSVALQAVAAACFVLLVPPLGVTGLALVSGLGPFVLTALYLWVFRHRTPRPGTLFFNARTFRLILAGGICALAVTAIRVLAQSFPLTKARDASMLIAAGAFGGTAYVLAAWLLRVPETGIVLRLLRHEFTRILGFRFGRKARPANAA